MSSTVIFITALEVLICCLILIVGVHQIFFNVEMNGCKMTWMYEYPEYLKVKLPSSVQKKFPKYGLFIYGEGSYANYLMSMKGNYKLDGIPVVFVHGNAGRYKQVRSPASVSLRKSEQSLHEFNYFSVDYEEELSALYGPFLQRQTQYLYHCIKRILRCYKHSKQTPQSVIAIGHSMGGLVIRGLYYLPNFNTNLVNTIITLASPHSEPPMKLDPDVTSYYKTVNDYWRKHSTNLLANVTLLSLGGSFRDYLVRSDLCDMDGISGNPFHMSTLTTSISYIWLATDHQCIVWCNELVRAVTRAFFRVIDKHTKQITQDHKFRAHILSNLFFNKDLYVNTLEGPSSCQQLSLSEEVSVHHSKSQTCFYISVESNSLNKEVLYIWAYTVKEKWIYTCGVDWESCTTLSAGNDFVLPGMKHTSRFASFRDFTGVKTIVIMAHKYDKFYIKKDSPLVQQIEVSSFGLVTRQYVFNPTFYTSVGLKSFTESWQVFEVTLDGDSENDQIAMISVPWSNEIYNFTYKENSRVFTLKIFTEKPSDEKFRNKHVQIMIWQHEMTSVKIRVRPLLTESVGQLIRFNLENILRYTLVFGVIRMLLNSKQLHVATPLTFLSNVRRTTVLICVVLVAKVIVWKWVNNTGVNIVPRLIFPQICLMLLSILIADSLNVMLNMIFYLCQIILYPFSLCYSCIRHCCSQKCTTLVNVGLVVGLWSFIPILDGKIPIAIVLMLLLVFHVVKIINMNSSARIFHKNILLQLVIPTLAVFSATPIIVYVKDIMNGFSHQYTSFINLQLLTAVYGCYLTCCCNDSEDSPFKRGEKFSVFLFVLKVYACVCLLPEVVVLYNLTYLVCAVLVAVILLQHL